MEKKSSDWPLEKEGWARQREREEKMGGPAISPAGGGETPPTPEEELIKKKKEAEEGYQSDIEPTEEKPESVPRRQNRAFRCAAGSRRAAGLSTGRRARPRRYPGPPGYPYWRTDAAPVSKHPGSSGRR